MRNLQLMSIDALKPRARNPRTHSKKQICQIANSILAFGFVVPLVTDEAGNIIAGHGRREAAKLLGLKEVPVIVARGLSEAKRRALALADNKIAGNAGWDRELLAIELAELSELVVTEGLDISIAGFATPEIDQLTADFEEDSSDPADTLDPAWSTDAPVSKRGDLLADLCGCPTLLQDGWTHLNLPAIAELEHDVPIGPGRVHHRKIGDLLHPEREPKSVLDEAKSAMGSMAFSAQYQQEPIIEAGNLIKWTWFRFYDDPPQRTVADKIIVSWDTALSAKDLASYSVAVVLQVRGETVYVLDVIREQLEYPDLRRKVIELHRKWRNACNGYFLLIENKGSGTGLIQDLKREHVHAIAIEPKGDKVMRMNNHTGRIEAGSVSLPSRAMWLEEFRREICAFPGGRHNDQVDAFSRALDRAFALRREIIVAPVLGHY